MSAVRQAGRRLVPGKCHRFATKWFTFPEKARAKQRQSQCSPGKCIKNGKKRFTFRIIIYFYTLIF